ncbi:Nck-associated protein 1 [Entophlyctis helioformis]|nr:Nck-associated protein 1 [Entophlyctis helioformis]
MASDISKWADHALILAQHAEGYLSALGALKHVLDLESGTPSEITLRGGMPEVTFAYNGTPFTLEAMARPPLERLSIFIDPSIVGLQKQLVKKFPDYGDLGKNLTSFQSGFAEISQGLRPHYKLLVAIADYLELSVPVLQVANKFSRLNFELNPDLTNAFLDLFMGVVSIVYLAGSLGPEIKLIAFAYNRAHQTGSGGEDCPEWFRVTKFLSTYDKPNAALQEALAPVASRIITLIIGMRPEFEHRFLLTAESMRSSGTFSLVPELSGFKIPPPSDTHMRTISRPMRLFKVYFFGLLVAPVEAFQQTASLDLMKTVAQYGFILPLTRNECLNVGTELETMAKNNSKVSKLKSMAHDAFSTVHASTIQLHRDRRVYLRMQLHQTLALIEDDALLAAKITTVTASMAIVRDEILWYFAHYDKDARKKKEAKTIDLTVIELIYLLREMTEKLSTQREVIRKAIARNLATSDTTREILANIEMLMQERNLQRETVGVLLHAIHSSLMMLQQADPIALAEAGELEGLRLNTIRFQAMATIGADLSHAPLISTICLPLSSKCALTKWLDHFDQCLNEVSSLRDLFYFQTPLQEHVRECLETESETLRYISALGTIATAFANNVTDVWPAEFEWVSTHTICYATEFYSALGQYASSVAYDTAAANAAIHARTLPQEAVIYLPKPAQTVVDAKKKTLPPVKKPQLEKLPLVRPGLESNLKGTDTDVQNIDRLRSVLKNTIHTLMHPTSVKIQSVEFQPIEFFIDSFAAKFRNHINQAVYRTDLSGKEIAGPGGEDVMSFDAKRPTVLMQEIKSFLLTARFVDEIAGTDTVGVLRDILIEQADLEKARSVTNNDSEGFASVSKNKAAREKTKAVASMNTIQPFLVTYMQWYCEFVGSKALNGTTVFSPRRHAFCNIAPASVEAELYTDAHELQALCELIGPQGVQFMDLKLTRQITIMTGSVQEMIQQNYESLDRIRKSWFDEGVMKDTLRKFRLMRDFLNKAVMAGFILEFRQLLATASHKVIARKFPHVDALVSTVHQQYPPTSLQDAKEYKLLDNLANQLGLRDRCDVMLRWALSALSGTQTSNPSTDGSHWMLLPHLFAAALWHVVYDDLAVYNTHYDALESNSHCLATFFMALTDNLSILTAQATRDTIGEMHREFLRVAAALLLGPAMQRVPEKEKEWVPRSLDAVFFTLQRFADTSPHISSDYAEMCLPYATSQVATMQLAHARTAMLPMRISGGQAGRSEEDLAF